jgi:hypothetical protein
VAQSVERVLGKDEVLGSNPSGSFRTVTFRFGEGHDPWIETIETIETIEIGGPADREF